MPVLLFQIALVLIIIHAVYSAVHKKNWFEFVYQIAIGVAALWFLLDQL